jgi:hypothetical protein
MTWIAAYAAIGLGIGAAGTSFLALLATAAPDDARAPPPPCVACADLRGDRGLHRHRHRVGTLFRGAPDGRRSRCRPDRAADRLRLDRRRGTEAGRRAGTVGAEARPRPPRHVGGSRGTGLHRVRLPVDPRLLPQRTGAGTLRGPCPRPSARGFDQAFGGQGWRVASRHARRRCAVDLPFRVAPDVGGDRLRHLGLPG